MLRVRLTARYGTAIMIRLLHGFTARFKGENVESQPLSNRRMEKNEET